MCQTRYSNESRTPQLTQPDMTVQFDLSQDQMTALLGQCRTEGRPVQDVCRSAIANYLQQKDLLAYNTAKALAD